MTTGPIVRRATQADARALAELHAAPREARYRRAELREVRYRRAAPREARYRRDVDSA